MKQQIIQALINSTVSENKVIKDVQQTIKTLSVSQNYCLVLMQIVDDQTIHDQIRLAALIQLKVNIDKRWVPLSYSKQPSLTLNQKTQIKQTLLTGRFVDYSAMIRCQYIQPFIRIYKTIVSLVVAYECRTWMPTEKIKQVLIEQPENTNITIVFIQAVITAFTERPTDNKLKLDAFLEVVLPLLYQCVTGQRKSVPLIYLTIKTVEKAFKAELTPNMKKLSACWMPLVNQIIVFEESSLSVENAQNKGSLDSCFYRAKKWAMKIVNKFFQTHTSISYDKNKDEEFIRAWIKQYAAMFIETIVQAVSKPNMPKTIFYAFKALAFAANKAPKVLLKYSEYLLFTIIPPFARLVSQDEQLAKDDPMQFLKSQEDIIGLDGKPKSAAINLWTSLIDLGFNSQTKTQGPNLQSSLKWIFQHLSSTETDLIAKEQAMLFLNRVKYIYQRYKHYKQPITTMIENYVIPHLNSQVMLIKARAIEVFDYYGDYQFSQVSQKQIVESIYKSLCEPNMIILNIKSACAFNCILKQKNILEMVKPYLKQLLQVYIKLISEHQIQNLVASLEGIVEIYGNEIEPFAVDLISYLSSQFITFSDGNNNNINNGGNETEEFEMAATACLDAMKKIIDFTANQNILTSIEPSVLQVVEQSFTHQGCQYYEAALDLLSIYIFHCDTISQKIWFFYPCIIYNILGLPDEQKEKQIPILNPHQARILNKMEDQYAKDNFQISMNVLRNYIHKSTVLSLQNRDMFGNCGLNLMLKIFQKAFHAQNRQVHQVLNSAALFINVFENTKCIPSMLNIAWQIVKITLVSIPSITGKKMAYQMFLLSFMVSPPHVLEILNSQTLNGIEMFKSIMAVQKSWNREHQINRVVLGFSSMFLMKDISYFNPIIDEIFKFLVRMVIKLAKAREKKEVQQEFDDDNDYDVTDCWVQEKERFKTQMEKIDSAVFFESSLKTFGEKNVTEFARLRGLLSQEDEKNLELSLVKAKQKFLIQHTKRRKLTQLY